MSDYLSNLVDRSLDRADVIQPRLPSLFEPAQVMGSPMPGLWQEAEPIAQVIEQSVVTETRNPQSVAQQPSPIARIFDRVVNRRSPESDSNPQPPSLPSPTVENEVSQPRFQTPPELAQPESVARNEPTIDPANASVIQPRSLQPQIKARQIADENVAVEQPEIASNSQLDRDRPISNLEQSPSLNPATISVQNRSDRIESTSLPTDLTSNYNPPGLGQTSASATIEQIRSVVQAIEPEVVSTPMQPTPVIQVTIGRIEVRATTATATPAATSTRSKPPVMSLDEYLYQRGGGK